MSKKLTEKQLEKFWDEAELLAQEKIFDLLTRNLPLPGLKLITQAYNFSEEHQNLTGLFLGKDVDYRTLKLELRDRYVEEELPSKEYLAEEIALWYVRNFIKEMMIDLQDYSPYDPSLFQNLIED